MAEATKIQVSDNEFSRLVAVWNDTQNGQKAFHMLRIMKALFDMYSIDWQQALRSRESIFILGQYSPSSPVSETIVGRLWRVAPGLVLFDADPSCYKQFCSGLLLKDFWKPEIPYSVRSFGCNGLKGTVQIRLEESLKNTKKQLFKDCAARVELFVSGGMDGDSIIDVGIPNHRWPFMKTWIEHWL